MVVVTHILGDRMEWLEKNASGDIDIVGLSEYYYYYSVGGSYPGGKIDKEGTGGNFEACGGLVVGGGAALVVFGLLVFVGRVDDNVVVGGCVVGVAVDGAAVVGAAVVVAVVADIIIVALIVVAVVVVVVVVLFVQLLLLLVIYLGLIDYYRINKNKNKCSKMK